MQKINDSFDLPGVESLVEITYWRSRIYLTESFRNHINAILRPLRLIGDYHQLLRYLFRTPWDREYGELYRFCVMYTENSRSSSRSFTQDAEQYLDTVCDYQSHASAKQDWLFQLFPYIAQHCFFYSRQRAIVNEFLQRYPITNGVQFWRRLSRRIAEYLLLGFGQPGLLLEYNGLVAVSDRVQRYYDSHPDILQMDNYAHLNEPLNLWLVMGLIEKHGDLGALQHLMYHGYHNRLLSEYLPQVGAQATLWKEQRERFCGLDWKKPYLAYMVVDNVEAYRQLGLQPTEQLCIQAIELLAMEITYSILDHLRLSKRGRCRIWIAAFSYLGVDGAVQLLDGPGWTEYMPVGVSHHAQVLRHHLEKEKLEMAREYILYHSLRPELLVDRYHHTLFRPHIQHLSSVWGGEVYAYHRYKNYLRCYNSPGERWREMVPGLWIMTRMEDPLTHLPGTHRRPLFDEEEVVFREPRPTRAKSARSAASY